MCNVKPRAHAPAARSCGDPRNAVPLYRAYSSKLTNHFYTTDYAEYQNAIKVLKYSDEGVTGYVFTGKEPHTVPFYRLYYEIKDSSGNDTKIDHFYTTDAVEVAIAEQNCGYKDNKTACYIYPDALCGALPLYRLFNGNITDHFYTMSATERDQASNVFGYTKQGIAGYIFPY